MTNPIFMGDNTAAFENNFITINLNNPLGYIVSKAEFVINGGCPKIPAFINPKFPLIVNLNSQQTAQLQANNVGRLVVWDSQNRPTTCKGVLNFQAKNGVICNVARTCC